MRVGVQQAWPNAVFNCLRKELVGHVLFLRKSLTSLALKSRTGTWCSAAGPWTGDVIAAGAEGFPLGPQAPPEGAVVACGRGPSLVGVLVPEERS